MVSLEHFRNSYLTESTELLEEMEQILLCLDPETADNETLNAIFRCAHSIKGGAGAFGLDDLVGFTHVLEALLDAMREGKTSATRENVDLLLQSVDVVGVMLSCAREDKSPPENLGKDLLAKLTALTNGAGAHIASQATAEPQITSTQQATWQIDFLPHETLFSSGNEPLRILRELAELGQAQITCISTNVPPLADLNPFSCALGWSIALQTDKSESDIHEVFEFVSDHCDLKVQKLAQSTSEEPTTKADIPTKAMTPAEEQTNKAPTQSTSIRVDIEKVDRLVNMVGELVITEAMLRAQAREIPVEQYADLLRGIDELSQHTRELQEAVMSVRMQPVKSVFSRMPRIVRDLSTQLGKEITLNMSGENTEVDKTLIEQLGDPLTHMIRNSCDHGIETMLERKEKGKNPQGTIHLAAEHRGGRIVIQISDDGAGINREKVLEKAKERGLLAHDATPSNEEIDQIIFMAGFSTAEKVTNVSGRGVGMDVVRRNIEGMGGAIRVANTPGKGSSFTISLPLTLAILDGMIVRVGAENFIIPITSIIETLRPAPEQVRRVESHSDVINVRGEFISLVYLHRVFGIENAVGDPSKALVVLVECGQQKIGLVVDELIGQQQVVIKSLEANSDPVQGVSGATILGDGRVSLILEINDLAKISERPPSGSAASKAA